MIHQKLIMHFSKLSKSNRKFPLFCNAKWWYHDIFENCSCNQKCKYDIYTKKQWTLHTMASINAFKYGNNTICHVLKLINPIYKHFNSCSCPYKCCKLDLKYIDNKTDTVRTINLNSQYVNVPHSGTSQQI